jgi:predicted N-acetyltransferase YhbS
MMPIAVVFEHPDTVTIRQATEQDAAGVLACLRAAFAPFEIAYTPEAFEDTVLTPELLRKRMATMSVLVAMNDGGVIVGTISYAPVGGGTGNLRGMAVSPDWHGRGVAEQLLAVAEDELRKSGCLRVTLTTTAPLKRAMRFYEKNGFRRSGKTADFFGMDVFEHIKILR